MIALLLALAVQGHAGHGAPAPQAQPDPHAGHAMPVPAPAPAQPEPHAAQDEAMGEWQEDAGGEMADWSDDDGRPAPHSGMDHGTGGTSLPAGNAPAPAAVPAIYADRIWGPGAMAPAREQLRREHGGGRFDQLMLNLAEIRIREGREGYAWDGEYWWGGDINRLTLKSEGEGSFGDSLEGAEVQLLYSRAIGPYFDVQGGVRQDVGPGPNRTYAAVGVEGLAPYWFDVEAMLFLSDRGDLFGRVEAYYDQRITQRLVLQPRVELDGAFQTVARDGIGSGLSSAEAGLRLRYEFAREFAPYVGVNWERRLGETARLARAAGEGTGGTSLVAGVRFWF